MVTATKEKQENNSRGTFDITRFEKVMQESGTTWDDLNNEIDVRTKKMLTNKSKQPMLNVVSKCCVYMNIDGAYDYVMGKSEFTRRQPTMVKQQNQNNRYKCNVDVFKKAFKLSQWNLTTLSYLLEAWHNSLQSYRVDTFSLNDANTICWALNVSPRKLFNIDSDTIPTGRVINKKQTEKLTRDDFEGISLADLCNRAKIDRRLLDFSKGPIYVSDYMYIRLDDYKKSMDKKGYNKEIGFKHKILPKANKKKKETNAAMPEKKMPANEKIKKETKEEKEMNTTLTQKIQVPEIKDENKGENTTMHNNTFNKTYAAVKNNKELNEKYDNNNKTNSYNRPFVSNKDVLTRIQHMSNEELDKVEKMIKLVREMRQISDNF